MKIKSVRSLGVQDVFDVINSETSNFLTGNGEILKNSSVIDEANFLETTEDSKKSDEDIYDAGEEMYDAVYNRMTSRFMVRGKIPGLIALLSSHRYPDSFMERKMAEIIEKGEHEMNAFCRSRSLWEAKGAKYFDLENWFEVDIDSMEIINPHGKGPIK